MVQHLDNSGHESKFHHFLPPKVTDVSREFLRSFPHTKRVGNYLLGKTLGEGSFAKVKEALHTLTGEKVAVKVIDKKKARDDAYVRKNLRREGKLLQMVQHPHIVQLYEILETENSYYLVTELCRGGDLMDHICHRRRLDEREARRFIRQILTAVDFLHRVGILHRDLKVENLLLDENKRIKIIDFGLSNAVRVTHLSDGRTTFQEFCVTQCGSPAYAAPELLGNKKYGPKVDIWSIGVNMFAMLTGNLPFTVEPFNIKALYNKMISGEMNTVPDHLGRNCRDLLKQLLTPDPEKRITLQDAMIHPWIAESGPVDQYEQAGKIRPDDLLDNVLQHMAHNMGFPLSDIIRLVTANIPNGATATYHLLNQKLHRYQAEQRIKGEIPTPNCIPKEKEPNAHEKNKGGGESVSGQVIELLPLNDPKTAENPPKEDVDNLSRKEATIGAQPLTDTHRGEQRARKDDSSDDVAERTKEANPTENDNNSRKVSNRQSSSKRPLNLSLGVPDRKDSLQVMSDEADANTSHSSTEFPDIHKKASQCRSTLPSPALSPTSTSKLQGSSSGQSQSRVSGSSPSALRQGRRLSNRSPVPRASDDHLNNNLHSPEPNSASSSPDRLKNYLYPNRNTKNSRNFEQRNAQGSNANSAGGSNSQSTVSSGGHRSASPGRKSRYKPHLSPKLLRRSTQQPPVEKHVIVDSVHYDRFARRHQNGGAPRVARSIQRDKSPSRKTINLSYSDQKSSHSPSRLSPSRLTRRPSMETSQLAVPNPEQNPGRRSTSPRLLRRSSTDQKAVPQKQLNITGTLEERVLDMSIGGGQNKSANLLAPIDGCQPRDPLVALPAISPTPIRRKSFDMN